MEVSYNNIPEALSEVLERLVRIEGVLLKNSQGIDSIPEELLTITQAAQFLKISVSTVYGKVCKQKIPFLKNGKRIYFRKTELTEWLKAGTKAKVIDFSKETDSYLSTLKQKSNAA
jgi:excisionase family DNA binding protein